MQKFPFNPEGLNALCRQLYQLNDLALAIEATTIEADFKTWTMLHFELDQSQQLYLSQIPFEVNRFLAFQTSFAVGNRLRITLIKPELTGVRASKLFQPKATLAITLYPDNNYVAAGELLLQISY